MFFLLNDLSERMGLVKGFLEIENQKIKLKNFIKNINKETTFGELYEISNECHIIIDENYWKYSITEFEISKTN